LMNYKRNYNLPSNSRLKKPIKSTVMPSNVSIKSYFVHEFFGSSYFSVISQSIRICLILLSKKNLLQK